MRLQRQRFLGSENLQQERQPTAEFQCDRAELALRIGRDQLQQGAGAVLEADMRRVGGVRAEPQLRLRMRGRNRSAAQLSECGA